jgi:cytochrome c oxidase subunit 1
MIRFLYSTDARDIGILYLILSGISGIMGTILSLIIRIILMDIDQVNNIGISNNIFNNIVSMHALLMIFFFIMPSLFGSFW